MATLTLSSTVLNGSFAYTDEGVSASGTFSANDGAASADDAAAADNS